jgi:hypothetical protein
MSDRELLEAAARVAGIELQRSRLDDPLFHDMLLKVRDPKHNGRGVGWNPLTDDGDALRLAQALKIDLSFIERDYKGLHHNSVEAACKSGCYYELSHSMESVRRVIVRAAGAIALPEKDAP